MKYVVTICSIVLGMTLAGVGARADKLRLAQELTVPKCVAICNSNGFSCAKNCGLSGGGGDAGFNLAHGQFLLSSALAARLDTRHTPLDPLLALIPEEMPNC